MVPRASPWAPADTMLGELLAAAAEAETAEEALESARSAFQREPTGTNLDHLRDESARALEKEARFDSLWREASAAWFAAPPQPKPRPRWPGAIEPEA